jgi:hypothetical protein
MTKTNGQASLRIKLLYGICAVLVVACNVLFTQVGSVEAHAGAGRITEDDANFPVVDPLYIYGQLAYLTSNFQQREAGYVADKGHDHFATYWSQEMARNLQGFNPQIVRDDFAIHGWQGRPASRPAFNMEVSIAGLTHPEQEVIIGCHYDGEIDSTESAFDDTSGCAYELGVGQAMGNYWRAHHLYPARTIRFVIFDAEEQGVFGSFHYLNSTINGDLANITAMFNQEQSGINYPARFLGRLANPFMPDYIDVTPLQDNAAYSGRIHLTTAQRQRVIVFRDLWSRAIPAVFAQFRAEGYGALDYYNSQRQNSSQAIFSSSQESNLSMRDDPSSNSDQVPFIYAGLPVAMLTGDQSYYDSQPKPWAYPYDLPEDTLALMNTYTGGNSRMSPALALALALPAMLTTWMLNQPAVSGSMPADGNPLVALGDIGQTVAGQSLSLMASGFDPALSGAAITYSWDFGDGSTAAGASVTHTYKSAGTYALVLTASAASGQRVVKKVLYVGTSPQTYNNPYNPLSGQNTPTSVKIPVSDNTLPEHPPLLAPFAQTAAPTPQASTSPLAILPGTAPIQPTSQQAPASSSPWPLVLGLVLLALGASVVIGLLVTGRKCRRR